MLSLLWMGVIFWFSAQSADDSSQMSGELLRDALAITVPHWEQRSPAEQLSLIDRMHTLFRKAGHFSEYSVLGMLYMKFWCIFRKQSSRQAGLKKTFLLPALCAFGYAATDEFHQRFSSGRSCELRDICIDGAGACCGILIAFIIMKITLRIRKK